MCCRTGRIRQRVLASGRIERAQAQDATVANAAGFALFSVTRPGQLQGRAQLEATADDLSLTECDERSRDLDACLFRAHPDHLVEGVVVLGAAIGITGAILRDRADID